MTETATRSVGSKKKECGLCGREARTRRYRTPSGDVHDLCSRCHPGTKAPGGKSKEKRSLYSDGVLQIMYRFGGVTTGQAGRLLAYHDEDLAELDREARGRFARNERSEKTPLPSYRAARNVLVALRETEEASVRTLHRAWSGLISKGPGSGRAEDFYRFSLLPAGRRAVDEAGAIAGGREGSLEPQYRLHWSGGAKDDGPYKHCAHRNDWILQLLDSLEDTEDANRDGASIDFDSIWCESSPEVPLIGARLEKLNAAGEPKYDSSKQKDSKYEANRDFERVVPDFIMEMTFTVSPPGQPEGVPERVPEREHGVVVRERRNEEVYA